MEAQISPADEVLECACGTGLLTEGIAAKCKRLVATDFSEKMLEKAEKKCGKFGNVTFKRENILQIGEPDGRFDTVVAATSFICWMSRFGRWRSLTASAAGAGKSSSRRI